MEMESVFLELAIVFLAFWVLIVQEQPVQCCAVAMGSTPRAAASVSVAGRAPSVTCRLPSVLTHSVEVVGFVSWALVLATQDTKEKTVKKLTVWTLDVLIMVYASMGNVTAIQDGVATIVKY